MARREKRWDRLLDQLREEFERMGDALDDATDREHALEGGVARLQEEVERLTEMLEDRDVGDEDDRRPRPITRVMEPVEDDNC